MTSSTEVAAQILAFTSAEYLAAPNVDVTSRTRTLLYTDFEGIALAAPSVGENGEPHAQGTQIPIAVAYRASGERSWNYPLARNAIFVARNLSDGRVLVRNPFGPQGGHKRHSQRAPLDRGGPPPVSQLEGYSAEITWVDAKRAGLANLPGDWRLSALWYDQPSNDIGIRVGGDLPEIEPRQVFIPGIQSPGGRGEVTFLPDFEQPGIQIAVEPIAGSPKSARISGRMVLTHRAHMMPADLGGAETPDAVIAFTLLALSPNAQHQGWRFGLPAIHTEGLVHTEFSAEIDIEGQHAEPLVFWGIADDAVSAPVMFPAR